MDSYRDRHVLMSPTSSPEKMEYSEGDSSFDQSPLHTLRSRPGLQKRSNLTKSRRVSCPPQMYQQQMKALSSQPNTAVSSPSRRSTGDFLDTIDKDFGTMQLSSPPSGIHQLQRVASTPSTASSVSSLWSLHTNPALSSQQTSTQDSDSDNSNCSNTTIRANNNNNDNNKISTWLSQNDGDKNKNDDDQSDKMSTVSCRTTGPERAITMQNARKGNCKGQILCYIHSAVLCLAVCIVGYFGSAEVRKMWCISSQKFNVSHLETELTSKVFGQHIAVSVISSEFQKFFQREEITGDKAANPIAPSTHPKPSSVVFSLHGWTGIGKTYVSTIVSELIPPSSVTKLIIPLHFPHSGPEYSQPYQENIEEWILTNISSCAINLFIIDEMDKATEPIVIGLMNAIEVIKEKQWNNTKIVILLLSNTAGYSINKAVFDHLNNGFKREDLTQEMMHNAILNDPQATWHKRLYKKRYINQVVPFLPLQFEHVVKCIKIYLKRRGESLTMEKIKQIANEMEYFPQGNPLFSKTGCKRVTAKTDLYLD